MLFGSILLVTFETGSVFFVSINIASMGFFILPILPIGYSFAVEITYPVSEVMSNGTMMLVAQLLGCLFTAITSAMSINHPKLVPYFLIMIVVIPCILSLFVKEDLRRIKAANSNSNKDISNEN